MTAICRKMKRADARRIRPVSWKVSVGLSRRLVGLFYAVNEFVDDAFKLLHHLFRHLFRDLAADLAARIGLGMDIDIVFAGHEIGGLRVGQCRVAFDRARGRVRDGDSDAGVLAGLGGAVEVRGGRGAGETGIGELPAQLLGGGIVIDVGGAGAGAGVRGDLRLAVQRRLELLGEGGAGEGDRGRKRQRGKHGLGHGCALSLLTSNWSQNNEIPDLFPKSARSRLNFGPAYGWSSGQATFKVRTAMTVG